MIDLRKGNPPQQKWTDLPPHERHRLLGEIIDAMIYNGQAVTEVRTLLESFRDRGMIKSVILPDIDSSEFK